ncbi:hypothetical protein JPSP9_05480 [Staphylococcus pseudintermedius]
MREVTVTFSFYTPILYYIKDINANKYYVYFMLYHFSSRLNLKTQNHRWMIMYVMLSVIFKNSLKDKFRHLNNCFPEKLSGETTE